MGGTPQPQAEFWSMPDLVGCTLAEAENAIRFVTDCHGGVKVRSIDATGYGRTDFPENEWRVSSHTPNSGEWIGPDSVVSFAVVPDAALSPSAGSGTGTSVPITDGP